MEAKEGQRKDSKNALAKKRIDGLQQHQKRPQSVIQESVHDAKESNHNVMGQGI